MDVQSNLCTTPTIGTKKSCRSWQVVVGEISQKCSKLRDVIYGRPLSRTVFLSWLVTGRRNLLSYYSTIYVFTNFNFIFTILQKKFQKFHNKNLTFHSFLHFFHDAWMSVVHTDNRNWQTWTGLELRSPDQPEFRLDQYFSKALFFLTAASCPRRDFYTHTPSPPHPHPL